MKTTKIFIFFISLLAIFFFSFEELQKGLIENESEYCSYPLCNTISQNYDLTASNNPQDYLGERIAFELYSDWKNYQPLKKKVDELILGKTNDYDKLVAIANWVKWSKNYGEPSPANEHKSVIDIFHSDIGVCFDASILLTVMLRLAGIPSRSVVNTRPPSRLHAFNEVFIDGNWVQVDATFEWEEGDAYIQDLSKNQLFLYPSFVFEYCGHFRNVEDKSRNIIYVDLYFYKRKFIESGFVKNQGIEDSKLIFPSTAETLFYDESQNKIIGPEPKEELGPTWISQRLEVRDNRCLKEIRPTVFEELGSLDLEFFQGSLSLDFFYWAVDTDGEIWKGVPQVTGSRMAILPACKYRIHYYYNVPELNYLENDVGHLAYADFEVKKDRVVKITPDLLVKIAGSDEDNFAALISALRVVRTPVNNQ